MNSPRSKTGAGRRILAGTTLTLVAACLVVVSAILVWRVFEWETRYAAVHCADDSSGREISQINLVLRNLQRKQEAVAGLGLPERVRKLHSHLESAEHWIDESSKALGVTIAGPSATPAPPRAFYSRYLEVGCQLRLIAWGARGGVPSYDFEESYAGPAFPNKTYHGVTKGRAIANYVLSEVGTPTTPGLMQQRVVGQKRNGDPILEVYRTPPYRVVEMAFCSRDKRAVFLMKTPYTEEDRENANLSGANLNEVLYWTVPAAVVTITNESPSSESNLTIKADDTFEFCGDKYKVLSVTPNQLELSKAGKIVRWPISDS